MKLLKFGGTSVGTVDSLRNVKSIVESCSDEQVIVVVSALGGLTDRLIYTARMAAEGNPEFEESIEGIVKRHHDVVEGIVPEAKQPTVLAAIDPLLDELERTFRGINMLGELTQRTLDLVVSFGERISSHIVTGIIDNAVRFDSLEFIRTRTSFDKHVLDNEATQPLIHAAFDSFVGPVAVVPGFISTDSESGEITNLGRGGSDYTAAILAAALNARILEIWTDVDGFMTADPRIIDTAYVIDRMSFIEAMELCNFGAKVIYPPTIYPVFHKNIPIIIKNTFNPSAPGTLVSDQVKAESSEIPVKGLSSINDTCLVTLTGMGMVGSTALNSRIFNALASRGVSVFMVNQGSTENVTSFAVKNEASEKALKALNEEFSEELSSGLISDISAQGDLATIAIVGERMKNNVTIAGKVFNTLRRSGIPVSAFSHGSSETNISFVTELAVMKRAMKLIHDNLFLADGNQFEIHLYGDGRLAQEFIKSLSDADKHHSVTRHTADDDFTQTACLENSIIVDCSQNQLMSCCYSKAIDLGVPVVTANRQAAFTDERIIADSAIMPGAPVLSVIRELEAGGETIEKIEATFAESEAGQLLEKLTGMKVEPLSGAADTVRITSTHHRKNRIELSCRADDLTAATAVSLLMDIDSITGRFPAT